VIPYELIVPSASRPHLLEPALDSLLERVDQLPTGILVHDDAAFPGRQGEVGEILRRVQRAHRINVAAIFRDPPVSHGAALGWLLSHTRTPIVLYTQDDLRVVRRLPIARALEVMTTHGLHQVRFNKRATMGWKGEWPKREYWFPGEPISHKPICAWALPGEVSVEVPHPLGFGAHMAGGCGCFGGAVLTTADHWYFQTGLWRVAPVKTVVDWWLSTTGESFKEHAEAKINQTMNGQVEDFNRDRLRGLVTLDLPPASAAAMDPAVRARVQRTFIWGPIGEDRYVENLGAAPEDWALRRPRGGVVGPGSDRDSQADER
jgi:hypothetical protein